MLRSRARPAAPSAPSPPGPGTGGAPDPAASEGPGARATRSVPSALAAQLDGGRPEVLEAFRRARRTVLAGQRLDVGALAAGLGVDRTSLFRWVGSRDTLLAEVLWSVAAPTLDAAARDADAAGLAGAERVTAVLTRFVEDMITADFFRSLLLREPARALRLLTTTAAPVQARFTSATEALLAAEHAAGRLRPALPLHDLAYLLVRVAESFTYSDLIAGEAPDAGRARRAFAVLLAAP